MINTQQIIVLMPLFNIQMPANAQMFYGFIMKLASFNILPVQDFYDKYLPSPSWDEPLNERFDLLGFQSTFFLNNMGTMVLGLLMIPLLGCVLILLKPLSLVNRRIANLRVRLHNSLFWSQQIVLMNESFSMVCMCAFINVRSLTFDTKSEITNSVLSIIFVVLCVGGPFVIAVFLLYKFPQLGGADM